MTAANANIASPRTLLVAGGAVRQGPVPYSGVDRACVPRRYLALSPCDLQRRAPACVSAISVLKTKCPPTLAERS